MATALANKPAPPHQKMKRPLPPTVQTSTNGTKSSHSSPSPSISSKRPPPASQHSLGATPLGAAGINGSVNGTTAARLNHRRRDSQKPGDIHIRPSRPSKGGAGDNGLDRRKRMAEPHVRVPSYILKKYKSKPPSLIIHLHPTFFRFDQQDGNFPYTSPMKVVLDHLRTQTIPHDMVEELNAAGVKFYEGCLIVQVHDHRSTVAHSQASSAAKAHEKNIAFSIHNYNEHLTPSPYVPYPKSTSATEVTAKSGSATADACTTGKDGTQEASASQKVPAKGPRIFTTVLLPTPRSLEEEIFLMTNAPESRSVNRKQSQASVANRAPASATMPHPPTPLSAVPSTPITGPPNKKHKMTVGENDTRQFQSRITSSTAAPLYLETVSDLQEASKLIQSLTDPLHKGDLPSPKTRKRTVAELEADEAQAASEQRFMLIMDESLRTKASGGDGEAGAVPFEARFERFKTIENIKAAHREKEQQVQEQKAVAQSHAQTQNKLKQEQAEAHRIMQERKAAEMAQRQESVRNLQALQQKAMLNQQQQLAANQNIHGHGPAANGVMPNQQHMPSNAQPPHSSPIPRNLTPHSNPRSSPLVGNIPHSVPMNVTTSNQGVTSSPARPTSAAQHGHGMGGVAMAPNRSQQRPPSRIGTPAMSNGTPVMQHGTPVMKQGTPTPRLNQGSPPHPMSQHTPIMNMSANGMAAQHINNINQLTPEQARSIQQYQFDQRRLAHLRQQETMANNVSGNPGMSPMTMGPQNPMGNQQNHNLQQLAAQNQIQMRNYQAQQDYARQMNGGGMMPSTTPNPHARPMPPQPAHRMQNAPQQQQQQPQPITQQQQAAARMQMQYTQRAMHMYMTKLCQQYGGQDLIPPEKMSEARSRANQAGKNEMMKQFHVRQQQQQQMLQAQMAAAGAGQGMSGMGPMNGMGSVNGMGGMNGMPNGMQ
ncbi:MAG: hypothetical protein L6R35_005662 [Caloplaca aegaea]|nr:MAG: hypothetical protein L6R35_005662 [Caloplaca aegaea]